MKNNKGLSLIELVIAFALLALVGVAATGLLSTGSRLFSSSTKEIDLQTETQSAFNHLNNFIVDAQRGINFDAGTDENVLKIFNNYEVYYIKWKKADKELYFAEVPVTTPETIPSDADYKLLVSNVEAFTADLTDVNDKNKMEIELKLAYGSREYEGKQEYALRNDIKSNVTLTELQANPPVGYKSYVEEVIVSEDVKYCAKGQNYVFSARVKGKGYPSQRVTWTVGGSTKPEETKIDEYGKLTISADEGASVLTVTATSVGLTETNTNMSDSTTVRIIELANINIDYTESSALIGRVLRVNGTPVFVNPDPTMMGDIYHVEFRLPTADDITAYPDKNLKIYDGLELYQSSSMTNSCDLILGEDMENDTDLVFDADGKAEIRIIVTSPLDDSKIFFPKVVIKKSDLTGLDIAGDLTVSRGTETALSAKLEAEGITSREIRTTWAITDDAGLGNKVSINSDSGVLKIDKNIDYNRQFELEITATARTTDSSKEIKRTVKVVIPKVTISVPAESTTVKKGSSDRVTFLVNGLKVEKGDIICTSKPSLKNTLMYCTEKECVISVGEKETRDLVAVRIMLKENTSISNSFSLYILSQTDMYNVEGRKNVYAPYYKPSEVGSGKEEKAENGTKLKYTVDGDRTKLTINTTVYYYNEAAVKNGVTGWWMPISNVEGEDYYIPVPGLSADLPNAISVSYKLNYDGHLLTYSEGSSTTYVEVEEADGVKKKFYLSGEAWKISG